LGKGKEKKPKLNREPSGNKNPRIPYEPSSYNNRRAAWRISHLEMCDPYGWHKIDLRTFDHIRAKLSGFESMTWNQILVDGKKHHHSIDVDKIIKPAQERLSAIEQDDIDKLVSLSLTGRNRVWGILEEGVLRLLWWDPNHEICPSPKKHT
jgi:hypothetical protein